jgi:hypothetical protein
VLEAQGKTTVSTMIIAAPQFGQTKVGCALATSASVA